MNNTKKFNFCKKININFEGGEITGNAGMLLFNDFLDKLNTHSLLEKYLDDTRDGNYNYSKAEIIYQKILRIANGMTSNNNYVYQKDDPVFKEIHNNKIASSATCSRLENELNYKDVSDLKKVIKDLEKYNIKQSKTTRMIIDIDTTNDPASENLEGAKFNGHYGINCFSPLLAFNGLTGDVLKGVLRPGDYHCSTLAHTFISTQINFYKQQGVTDLTYRLDSAFSVPELYELFEEENVEYFIKLKANKVLYKKVDGKGTRGISTFEEFEYKAKSWNKPRRVVACIDWKSNKKQLELFPTYSFIITNNKDLSKEEVFSMYNGRATIEKSIEEAKNEFDLDHLSHGNFRVNSAIFQIHLITMQLTQLFRKFCLNKKSITIEKIDSFQESKKITKKFKKKKVGRKELKLPSVSTIRKKIFAIPAKVIRTGRKIYYKCASSFPFKNLFMSVFDKVQSLTPLII